jgi:hypothetical protein
MEVLVREVMEARPVLDKLMRNEELPFPLKVRLAGMLPKLNHVFDTYAQEQRKVVESMGLDVEAAVVPPERVTDFRELMGKIDDSEVELEISPLKINEDLGLSPLEMAGVSWLITFDVNA